MQRFLNWLDATALTNQENEKAKWLDRIAFFFLILMVLSAPHSIAATQTTWILGNLAWVIRLFIKPRPPILKTPLNLALWIFFLWSVVTCFFSYTPVVSFDKLRGAALFLIFFYVANNLRSFRAIKFIASALIFSTMVVALWTPLERLIGRGVRIQGVSAESPLRKALLYDGDTILKAGKKKIGTPDELAAEIEKNDKTTVEVYRGDYYFTVDVERKNLLAGGNALEKLGVESWGKSRNWRSMGFYGHWTTFSEVLQLIASLTLGLLIASFRVKKEDSQGEKPSFFHRFTFSKPLLLCFTAMCLALLLNSTRASQLGLIAAAGAMIFLVNRKMVLIFAAVILPVALAGIFFFQNQIRPSTADSDAYRVTVYEEGFKLWTQNARHFFVGVGMDSIKKNAAEWQLFDQGKLPLGHFHSTLLQLAVERGLPALLLWFWILWLYAKELRFQIPNSKFQIRENQSGIRIPEFGIILGVFGGLVGFFTSGIVHYNLGDAEVAMVFFLLMGIGTSLKQTKDES